MDGRGTASGRILEWVPSILSHPCTVWFCCCWNLALVLMGHHNIKKTNWDPVVVIFCSSEIGKVVLLLAQWNPTRRLPVPWHGLNTSHALYSGSSFCPTFLLTVCACKWQGARNSPRVSFWRQSSHKYTHKDVYKMCLHIKNTWKVKTVSYCVTLRVC